MRRRGLFLSACAPACALAFALAPAAASAQSKVTPSLDLRGFRASTDPAAGVYYEPVSAPGHLDASGAVWLSYASSQIVLHDRRTDEVIATPVEHSLTGDLTLNLGLFGRASLGAVVPFAIYQSGSAPTAESDRVLGELRLPAQAMGDVALTGKVALIPPTSGDHGGFALGLHERLTLPSGDEASFLGEGDVTSETRLLLEYTTRAFGVFGTTGFKLRGSEERFACAPRDPADTEPDDCLTRVGHELPLGLSVRVTPRGLGIDPTGRWTAFAEVFGRLPLTGADAFTANRVSAVEAAAGVRYAFMRDFSALASVGTALVAGVGEPPVRGVVSLAWAPRTHDADGDRIDDDVDQCRQLGEDRDGFEDDDGCPEGDNDGDGVPDQADKCPDAKEDPDGHRDDDGCPDPDNDGDGVPDASDACPDEATLSDEDAARTGCPRRDQDKDGVPDGDDACLTQPEDLDKFQDADGCPDPDNDADTVLDADDKCPNVPGVPSTDAKQNGCPEVDADGDTFWGTEDKCPLEAEDFNGKDDEDGCPDDPKKKPFLSVTTVQGEPAIALTKGVRFTKDGVIEPDSMPVVRAVGAEMMKHPALGTRPAWSVAVGVRPSAKGGQTEAMLRAFTVVDALRRLTRRDTIAETVGWAAVKDLPGVSAQGVGFLLLTGAPAADVNPPDPAPAKP